MILSLTLCVAPVFSSPFLHVAADTTWESNPFSGIHDDSIMVDSGVTLTIAAGKTVTMGSSLKLFKVGRNATLIIEPGACLRGYYSNSADMVFDSGAVGEFGEDAVCNYFESIIVDSARLHLGKGVLVDVKSLTNTAGDFSIDSGSHITLTNLNVDRGAVRIGLRGSITTDHAVFTNATFSCDTGARFTGDISLSDHSSAVFGVRDTLTVSMTVDSTSRAEFGPGTVVTGTKLTSSGCIRAIGAPGNKVKFYGTDFRLTLRDIPPSADSTVFYYCDIDSAGPSATIAFRFDVYSSSPVRFEHSAVRLVYGTNADFDIRDCWMNSGVFYGGTIRFSDSSRIGTMIADSLCSLSFRDLSLNGTRMTLDRGSTASIINCRMTKFKQHVFAEVIASDLFIDSCSFSNGTDSMRLSGNDYSADFISVTRGEFVLTNSTFSNIVFSWFDSHLGTLLFCDSSNVTIRNVRVDTVCLTSTDNTGIVRIGRSAVSISNLQMKHTRSNWACLSLQGSDLDITGVTIYDAILKEMPSSYSASSAVELVSSTGRFVNACIAEMYTYGARDYEQPSAGIVTKGIAPLIANVTVTGCHTVNWSSTLVAALWCAENSHPVIVNSIFQGLYGAYFNRGSKADFVNCDFPAGRNSTQIYRESTSDTLFFTNCISQRPLYVDSAAGDFRLADGSLCIDAGIEDTAGIPLGLFDCAGKPRIAAGKSPRVDIGAYENESPTPVINTTAIVRPDFSVLSHAGMVQVTARTYSGAHLVVTRLDGRQIAVVPATHALEGFVQFSWNTSAIAAGMYVLAVVGEEGRQYIKKFTID